MAFTLPVFNMTTKISTDYGAPNSGLSFSADLACQKYIYSRAYPNIGSTANYWGAPAVEWRYESTAFYALFDPNNIHGWGLSIIRVEPNASVYYRVWWWEIMHQGFDNEYPVVYALLCNPNDGMYVTPGSANQDNVPLGFPYLMGPLP